MQTSNENPGATPRHLQPRGLTQGPAEGPKHAKPPVDARSTSSEGAREQCQGGAYRTSPRARWRHSLACHVDGPCSCGANALNGGELLQGPARPVRGLVSAGGAHRPDANAWWSHARDCEGGEAGPLDECRCGAEALNDEHAQTLGEKAMRASEPAQRSAETAEQVRVSKRPKVDLLTLTASLKATTEGPAATELARHESHTGRKRMVRTFARDLAGYLCAVQRSGAGPASPDRAAIDAAAAKIEGEAEGVECWAFLRGFEAGRKRGEADAIEAVNVRQLAEARTIAAREHSDAAVNRAEFWRYFASALGLAETASWEQLRELFDSLRAAARVLQHWRSEPAALPTTGGAA